MLTLGRTDFKEEKYMMGCNFPRQMVVFTFGLVIGLGANAAILTFDQLIPTARSISFDADGDGIADVVFSDWVSNDNVTGLSTGPVYGSPALLYLNGNGLRHRTRGEPDIRVDFIAGRPTGNLSFGFALSTSWFAGPGNMGSFSVFSAQGELLAQKSIGVSFTTQAPPVGSGGYAEAHLSVDFDGNAAYGLFNFASEGNTVFIDNFTGNFGSLEAVPVPEAPSFFLMIGGLVALGAALSGRRRNSRGDA